MDLVPHDDIIQQELRNQLGRELHEETVVQELVDIYGKFSCPPHYTPIYNKIGELQFSNDLTGEISYEHPGFRRLFALGKGEVRSEEKQPEQEEENQKKEEEEERTLHFRCHWQEVSQDGTYLRKTVHVLVGVDTGRVRVKIRGVEEEDLELSHIQNRHGGRLEASDLYIGAKIQLLGRDITLQEATTASVEWLESVGKSLKRKKRKLQKRVESLGFKACVEETYKDLDPTSIKRNSYILGSTNLQKLKKDIVQLESQIRQLFPTQN